MTFAQVGTSHEQHDCAGQQTDGIAHGLVACVGVVDVDRRGTCGDGDDDQTVGAVLAGIVRRVVEFDSPGRIIAEVEDQVLGPRRLNREMQRCGTRKHSRRMRSLR